jgi:NADPH-dependent curcumin reductase CurA
MTQNRFWRLNAHPHGNDFAAALSLKTEAMPVPGMGEVLVRADWLSMDAGTRMWMTPRTDGYQPPLPLGSRMVGVMMGRVTASCHPDFAEGDLVRGFGQWAEVSLVTPELAGLVKVDDSIADVREHFGALGMNAWTAYVGITEVGKAQPGEAVLVSAAAGATGSLACQVARNLGCRVIGIAGGPDKCRYLIDTLGVDMAIDYRAHDVAAELAKVEGGINFFFDNVGGDMLDAAFPNMAHYGRIAICGMVSAYDRDSAAPGPARFDQILMRRLRVEGFFIPDFLERGAEFAPVLHSWMDEGKLATHFDETRGIDNVLVAYDRMLSGKGMGKVIVDLRP